MNIPLAITVSEPHINVVEVGNVTFAFSGYIQVKTYHYGKKKLWILWNRAFSVILNYPIMAPISFLLIVNYSFIYPLYSELILMIQLVINKCATLGICK